MKKNNSTEDSGSFFSGFTIGLFAGAVGYYLFASDKGSKLVQKVTTEWEKAQKELPEKVPTAAKLSIKSSLKSLLHEIIGTLEESGALESAEAMQEDSLSKTKKRTRKKSKAQFKNTQ